MEPTIYLYFDGTWLEAMTFYAETLGGEINGVFKNSDAPDPESRMPGGDDLVMNMNMRLGSANIMASDAPGEWYTKPQGFNISLAAGSIEDAERIFNALSRDGEVRMPLEETFWAERFAMFSDRFGTPWMINFTGSKAMN
ncbi:VOC family protein [Oricola sp.]|uniref:VOC family protein n=1 Tax=Oricola sp. TaxID=1979950 RepID=UPI003517EED0